RRFPGAVLAGAGPAAVEPEQQRRPPARRRLGRAHRRRQHARRQLGARLGLDNAGVSESRALGGSVLGIGKQLSPRLYLGFGVSLLGTGQVITLKYLLRRGFDVEIETSTLETRGSINYRHESD